MGLLSADPSVPQSPEPDVFSDLVSAAHCLGSLFLLNLAFVSISSRSTTRNSFRANAAACGVRIPARMWVGPLHLKDVETVLSDFLQTGFPSTQLGTVPPMKNEGLTCY